MVLTISIRAPARGATSDIDSVITDVTISIRAPARGATVGIDHGDNRLIISIRAPARGATGCTGSVCTDLCISIRAPARGATLPKESHASGDRFQSALPRGERRFDTPVGLHFQPFQSALPRGERRRYFVNTFLYLEISIRAPARGATTC